MILFYPKLFFCGTYNQYTNICNYIKKQAFITIKLKFLPKSQIICFGKDFDDILM